MKEKKKMSIRIREKLQTLNLTLPKINSPAGNYVPYTQTGSLIFTSGQIPLWEGELRYVGKIGLDFSIAQGQEAARFCLLNILAHLEKACHGDLDRVERCIRLNGYINAPSDFTEFSTVMNGASDLLVDLFGDNLRHSRVAVGATSLPRGAAVEIDGIFEVQ